jgi:hypothetical protein
MDLANVIEQLQSEYALLHPVEKTKLGPVFLLAGPEHPDRKAQAHDLARKMRREVNRTGKLVPGDPEEEEGRVIDYLVACTLQWRDLEIEGAKVPWSAAEARKLYTNARWAWVRRQIKEALDEQEVFIKRSDAA